MTSKSKATDGRDTEYTKYCLTVLKLELEDSPLLQSQKCRVSFQLKVDRQKSNRTSEKSL